MQLTVPLWKRSLDLVVASLALIALSPVFVIVALLIKLDSRGPIFFRQVRVGQRLNNFVIFKFRTMVHGAAHNDLQLTVNGDSRITRFGRVLRWTKFDELPQLINVLRGEMSLVGPRPEVPRYVSLFQSEYQQILRVQPGITDLASLKYRDESAILQLAADPEREYVTRVLPDKIVLAKEYIRQSSFCFDVWLMFKTLVRLFVD